MNVPTPKQAGAAVISIVFLVLLFRAAFPLTLGYFFAWEPPAEPDAPYQAVLRIVAPAGAPYRIEWGPEALPPTVVSEVQEGKTYRDHVVPSEAKTNIGNGGVEAKVYRGTIGSRAWEGELGAVLFVGGEYADCSAANEGGWFSADVNSRFKAPGGAITRMTCGAYRY